MKQNWSGSPVNHLNSVSRSKNPNKFSNEERMKSPTNPKMIPTPGKPFYAGAKFESHPSHRLLPAPPSHWTTHIQRSQSEPSSPTIKAMQKGTTAIDVASLFGSPNPVSVAKSFPGERMMQALIKAKEEEKAAKKKVPESTDVSSSDEELKEILPQQGPKKAVLKKEVAHTDLKKVVSPSSSSSSTTKEDLQKVLRLLTQSSGVVITPENMKLKQERRLNQTCQGSVTPLNNYKEMSDQLKTLMKVAA